MEVRRDDIVQFNKFANFVTIRANMPALIEKFGEDDPEIIKLAKNVGYKMPTKAELTVAEASKLDLDYVKKAKVNVAGVDWLELAKSFAKYKSFIYLFDRHAQLDPMTILKYAKTNNVIALIDYVLWNWQNNTEPISISIDDVIWLISTNTFADPTAAILPGVSRIDMTDKKRMLVKFGKLTNESFDFLLPDDAQASA